MKKKIEIKKIAGKVAIKRGKTILWGFKNYSEARKFLNNFLTKKYATT